MKANSVGSVSFLVTPVKLGLVDMNVRARTRLAGDAISRPLKVKPPGQTQKVNTAALLDLRGSRSYSVNLTTKFPAKRVADSDSVKISFISDILGPAITNLDKLLGGYIFHHKLQVVFKCKIKMFRIQFPELPTGCGEQNMVHFVPDILVLDYLQVRIFQQFH